MQGHASVGDLVEKVQAHNAGFVSFAVPLFLSMATHHVTRAEKV